MFNAKSNRIDELAKLYKNRINELETIFDKRTNVYIDFANIIHWQDKLGWHIDLKRLQQFLHSFDTVGDIKFYNGYIPNDPKSNKVIEKARKRGYIVITKPVKFIKLSIDASSVSPHSTELIKQFVRNTLLRKLNVETIEYLNKRLKELNQQGIKVLEDRKCNFDVEIGVDMLLDFHISKLENYILWSGDSDFAGPIEQLLEKGKKVVLFATARRVATELNDLRSKGLLIFDIQKIRNFICYKK
ncbi:MAG: NYN domain-containing protein [Candidatus Omnitrophica bacterium]|nr:NYN domain-containing protein [Candidatus Omnitrophota bacterium]